MTCPRQRWPVEKLAAVIAADDQLLLHTIDAAVEQPRLQHILAVQVPRQV